jgi:hypothetical protein
MSKGIPGTTDVDVRENDGLWLAVNTLDNRFDDVLGIRPVQGIGRVLTAIAPANVISNLTDLEKPGTVIEKKMDDLERDIKSKKVGRPF